MQKTKNSQQGFTLLEILLVVAMIAILAGIVIIAINPGKQLGATRDSQRSVDVNTILNAVYQYSIDNNNGLPVDIDSVTGTSQVLGTATTGCDSGCSAVTTVAACVDLSDVLTPDFVVGIPTDPSSGTAAKTDYYINKGTDGRITVGACDPEGSNAIVVSR